MDIVVLKAFESGQIARIEGDPSRAIIHFTRALEIFHATVGSQYDPSFWARILFCRAEAHLLSGHFAYVEKDVKQALAACPEQCSDLETARAWFTHESKLDHRLARLKVSCCSAALHFAGGNVSFQSEIYSTRALVRFNLEEYTRCEQDVEECKRLDIDQALKTGLRWKRQGLDELYSKNFDQASRVLQLAELFLRPTYPVEKLPKHHWYDCWKQLIIATWQIKSYKKAVEAAKKWRQMEPISCTDEAAGWKERGNEMFKGESLDLAVDCYTLSIQYTPDDNAYLLGTLYSNRAHAYFRKKQFKKAKDDAEKCLKYRPDWSKSFYRLGSALMELGKYERALETLRDGLNTSGAEEDKYDIFKKIMKLAFNCEDGPAKVTFELPRVFMSKHLKDCVEKHHWKSLEVFLLGGGGYRSYAKGEGGIATGCCDLKEISLCDLIKSKPNMYCELINVMIDHGVLVDGRNEQDIPLALAVNYGDHDLAVILLKKNANPDGLLKSKYGKHDDTSVHTAFRIGLSLGHWQIFVHLMENRGCLQISNIADKKDNSLYHLVASGERMWPHVVEGINHLRKYKIDPTGRNKDGKTPLMLIRQNSDPRYRLLEESVKEFLPDSRTKKKKRKKKNKRTERFDVVTPSKCEKDEDVSRDVTSVEQVSLFQARCPTETELLRKRICQAIENLKIENERKECNDAKKTGENHQNVCSASHDETISQKGEELVAKTLTCEDRVIEDKQPIPAQEVFNIGPEQDDNVTDDMLHNDDHVVFADTFDKLTWEVECTSDVWKTLKDKKLPRDKKKQIVRIIRQLADGDMRGSLAKPLVGIAKESDILLFEAKLDRSARILWERAIAFSPRCSDLSDNNDEKRCGIYTEVVRIWDIVFDHDTVPRKIKKIIRSYNRGTSCFIRKNLKGTPLKSSSLSTKNDQKRIPKIYVLKEDGAQQAEENEKPCSSNESTKMFFPPGSPEETEYHILKFYAFSNAMVNTMLDNQNETKFDFPFRVSELEHSVISLAPKRATSILLLGRSGTGKTTCCLYRLWNNYQTYWKRSTFDEPTIPNGAQFIPRETEDSTNAEKGEGQTSACGERRTSLDDGFQDFHGCSSAQRNSISSIELDEQGEMTEDGTNQETSCRSDKNEDGQTVRNKPTLEHLHQAFITKNAVLCKEVEKNFIELSQACFSTRDDLSYQHSSSVSRFDQLEEQAWPLFICSRDWLLMLDASLPGEPFFRRNEDGKLERNVSGWGEEDNNLQEIPVQYSDDEDEDEEEIENKPTATDGEQKVECEQDLRREVTYQVFKNELWRKMTKKKKVDYHPSLVWTEIISFIKGSVEALHSEERFITLEEYQTIGSKRAPSFTADRETIYELFLAYERIKRSLGMFDEADVVHHIYHRLEHHVPNWSIHEIYVDETQDFTQAELSVIIRSCRNPNRLFFTGDTAQSIVRGIAFRFSDLRSLFYYMKESLKSVGQESEVVVPDRVYELTHNYRSHAGILNLASTVTDLLSYFFPESFDKLARDQGLFEGPKPVLLESCSFSDLAVILRGHKRKTSPIEFGAHQVILVASDEVRDSLPEELSLALVMTIYEAKGLEFDDVLIYNFFKDSQALKEWRVVGTYRENQDEDTNVGATGIAEIQVENLDCKARPLEFNPDQHKILVSEFKYLYTALTRARVNVWLFDECEEARAPMFEYFQKRDVVDVKQVHKTDDNMASLEGMFAHKSDKDQWKKQGYFFYGKGLWKVASKCFAMADERVWVKKCDAHEQAAKAATLMSEPRKLRLEFAKAAELFLQCNMKNEAEKCLFNARERMPLAKLHEKCNNFLKAAKIFQREGEFDMAARNFESAGDFERAAECLLKLNRYSEVLDLISRYNDLIGREQNHVISRHLRFDQRDDNICYQAAKFYQHRGDYHAMTDALEKLPIVKDRINFLQRNGFFDQAAELLLKEGKAQEAASLMRSKGKFLEAARYSADDKFIADCYLLAAQSTLKEGNRNKETEEFISGLLETATEMYKRCNNLNGEAEVLFARGKYFRKSADIEDAGKLYYQATNYAALTDCFLLLMEHEKDPRKFSRAKAINTLRGLLHLILALHKDKKENSERTAIAMCHVYFGIEDTDNVLIKKVPLEEKVRFTNLRDVHAKLTHDGVISAIDADMLIKDQLSRMATRLIKQLWNKYQQINDRCKSCPHFLAGATCDRTICIRHHAELSRALFLDRFYALQFLIRLEETIASFLKSMQRESAKVKKQLEQKLFIEPEFTACEWLYDLLFPRDGQLVSSYFMSERDLIFLRRHVSVRIKEFAERFLWSRSCENERWSSSDLFIQVYNMMHVAGVPVENLLCVEERKFEARCLPPHPGMFPDYRRLGRFEIFSKSLERSKTKLYRYCDVLGSIHAAVRKFLFAPAKRRGLPYPSIANAVMILERQVTACLFLYTRLAMNETFICLPESYLSMINFWDFVERSQTNRSTTFYDAIQYAGYFFQGVEGQKSFNHLQELATDLVKLTFGEVSWNYNVVADALCGNSVNCVEAERVLVLVLIMLCNCGRGIPEECEKLIREHLITSHLRQDLPEPLKKCVEDVRNATGFTDVVLCLRELLNRRPRQEKLCDVKWDDHKVKDSRRICKIENYSKHFRFQIDVIKLSSEVSQRKQDKGHEVREVADDEMNDNYSQVLNEDETDNQREEYNDEARGKASKIIQRAFSKWKSRKKAKDTLDEEIKNDPVKCHFQSFKLDKSGCTICAPVQFGDRSLSSTDTVSDPSSSIHHEEETKSTWQLLQQNTFESHCSKGSLHWKNEKALKNFKEFYEKRIVLTLKRATQLKEEMTKLNEETEVNCELDLHRLDDALSRLQNTIKKIEDERAWHSVRSIEKAADEVDTQTKKISNTKNIKAPGERGVDQDSDDEIDGNDDDGIGRLVPVSKVRWNKKNTRRKGRKR